MNAEAVPDPAADPHERMGWRADGQFAARALSRSNPQQREPNELAVPRGWTRDEIAREREEIQMVSRAEARPGALAGPLIPRRAARAYLVFEFAALFVAFPVLLVLDRHAFGQRIIPTLVGVGTLCLSLLLCDPQFDRRRLWNARATLAGMGAVLRRVLVVTPLLCLAMLAFQPDLLFSLPRSAPRTWLLVLVFYPLLSAYPQELIFRTFLFHRYRGILRTDRSRIAASGVGFALAHIFLSNWIAPVLSLAGGLLFARSYARSDSTLLATLEHGLWGDVLFTIGLGWYFYGGSIGASAVPG
jgi:membrane protease YdiL (CAAX protease family)